MTTEGFEGTTARAEPLHFDAHEFDGLRDELEQQAETLLKRTDQFVRANTWLCIALAVGLGCALGIAAGCRSAEELPSEDLK